MRAKTVNESMSSIKPLKTKLNATTFDKLKVGDYISDGYNETYEIAQIISKNPVILKIVMCVQDKSIIGMEFKDEIEPNGVVVQVLNAEELLNVRTWDKDGNVI
jgi:hypothetical protein